MARFTMSHMLNMWVTLGQNAGIESIRRVIHVSILVSLSYISRIVHCGMFIEETFFM